MCGRVRIPIRGPERRICEAVCVKPMCEGDRRVLEMKQSWNISRGKLRARGTFWLRKRQCLLWVCWIGVALKHSGAHIIPSKFQMPDMELLCLSSVYSWVLVLISSDLFLLCPWSSFSEREYNTWCRCILEACDLFLNFSGVYS